MTKILAKVTEPLRERYNSSLEHYKYFCYGFAAGQAEKVYLAVCRACMLRPAKEQTWYLEEIRVIAENFGLKVTVLDSECPDTPNEIWLHREPIGEWLSHPLNSPEWHRLRAEACGIPNYDPNYHMREGYGERAG
jgi:hypothetical protein